jgi:hypothetical protein
VPILGTTRTKATTIAAPTPKTILRTGETRVENILHFRPGGHLVVLKGLPTKMAKLMPAFHRAVCRAGILSPMGQVRAIRGEGTQDMERSDFFWHERQEPSWVFNGDPTQHLFLHASRIGTRNSKVDAACPAG